MENQETSTNKDGRLPALSVASRSAFSFRSETNLIVQADAFRVDRRIWKDEHGHEHTDETTWGKEVGTCGWYFVPPSERRRMESEGVAFEPTADASSTERLG